MCGIVGLHLRNPAWHPRLGALLADMLGCMTERGPDSAGVAIYDDELPAGSMRYSLRALDPDLDWESLAERLGSRLDRRVAVEHRAGDAVLLAAGDDAPVLGALSDEPAVRLVGHGQAMEVFKDVGAPREISRRYGIADRGGYQGLGHTRMATESAVTTDHSHPFAADADLCLVHNGSFSNYASVRRQLADEGIKFLTDNDSEVAARYIAYQMRLGAGLGEALELVLKELDGFFTLLVATRDEFAVVRDAFACKPAVIAESDDYVAMGSEFHALAGLPGIDGARIFEPMPEEVHVWRR